MADEPRTLLAILVAASDKTHEEHVRALEATARRMREPGATFSMRQFHRWLTGGLCTRPRAANRRVMEAYYHQPIQALLNPPVRADLAPMEDRLPIPLGQQAKQDLEEAAMSAAHESSEHAADAAAQIEDASIVDLQERIFGAARRYATTAPLSMFSDLVRIRNQAYRLLDRTKAPRQLEDLYVVAGQACGLLAGINYDLGYAEAAAEQARAAFTYGKIIGSPSLCAFALALRSTIAFWSGEPQQGVLLAEAGLEYRATGTAAVRLHAVKGRSWALQGAPGLAVQALTAADHARDGTGVDEFLDGIGGEFGFSPARLALCSAAAYIALGDGDAGAHEAQRAIDLFAELPDHERWFGGEYGARLDLVAARVINGDLAGAEEAMAPVLGLPPVQRTERLAQRVRALRGATTHPQHRSVPAARRIGDMIEFFVADSAPGALPQA